MKKLSKKAYKAVMADAESFEEIDGFSARRW